MESIKAYLKEIKKIPLLTEKEEFQFAVAAKKGDLLARQKMVNANLRLVINIAKKYSYLGIPLVDLIEDGNIGLIKAVDRFKPRKGFRFSTYAAWWIRQSISRAISDQSQLIRLPVYMHELVVKYNKTLTKLTQKYGRVPAITEIAKSMRMPIEKANKIIGWQTKTVSLETPIGDDDESHVMDLIKDQSVSSPQDNVDHMLDKERIAQLMQVVDEREKGILDLRFGLYDGKIHTLAFIARKLHLSRERVRQIEDTALFKLRRFIEMQREELY